jgi:hypothetical protein
MNFGNKGIKKSKKKHQYMNKTESHYPSPLRLVRKTHKDANYSCTA